MASIIIKLDKPVEAYGRKREQIELKEPSGGLYARLGEPRLGVYNDKSGHGYFVEQMDVINQYFDKLVDVEGDAAVASAVLGAISITDMKRLKGALFSFFDTAAERAAELKWTPSFSGSNS